MKRPMGYRTKRCKHGNKLRVWFRTIHRIKLEFEWPTCCDPKGSGARRPIPSPAPENLTGERGRGKGVPPSEAKDE